MAITSTINIDTVGGTIGSSVYLNGTTLIDTLTYTFSSNTISCAGFIASVTLSVTDYLALLSFYVAFNQLIITTFSSSQFVTTPFSSVTFVQSDDGVSQLKFEFLPGSIPLFYYTCTYPLGNVVIATRELSDTLSYAQWLFFLYLAANFKLSVLADYKL
jgi:hypothetical protein